MSLNLLVVDDSAVMRTMLIRTLRLSGVPLEAVHEAAHGRAALEILERHWVDLALVDLNMPVMNGEEFIAHVRSSELYESLPIMVVSTEGSPARIERIQRSISAFVRKPFTPEQIRDVVLEITGVNHDGTTGVADAGGSYDF